MEVIDTPRLSLPRKKIIKAIKEKQEECSSTSAKFSALFVVRANSVSDTDCGESINIFKDVFGRQFIGQIVVVVTHFDKVGRNINLKSFLGSCGAQLMSFIRERNLDVFFFDNSSQGDIRTSQVNDLISMIVSEKNNMVPRKKKKAIVSEKNTWS
ncbi:hypothetical protein CHS0354_041900 [Potamilus streckersoni]|uniref:AIG1-type G domain-containing protein n=1 Tax=Potamilus streckersoni TaxID=2493646 RepID=A0AAE0W0H1_9BIVA|nr:hypothetical protein CHS0354_041900 [Potamilus streckersoni]